jgi:hypothetical protein
LPAVTHVDSIDMMNGPGGESFRLHFLFFPFDTVPSALNESEIVPNLPASVATANSPCASRQATIPKRKGLPEIVE